MTVSSAYINTLEACQQLGRSVTYNEDSNGPSIEPRGTPQTTCWRLDRTPPTKTDGCGQLGNQTSKDVHYPKSQTTAAYQILWSIASNALQKSTKMASVRSSASTLLLMESVRKVIPVCAEYLRRNPHWYLENRSRNSR